MNLKVTLPRGMSKSLVEWVIYVLIKISGHLAQSTGVINIHLEKLKSSSVNFQVCHVFILGKCLFTYFYQVLQASSFHWNCVGSTTNKNCHALGWDWFVETDWSKLIGWDWLVETDWPRLIGQDRLAKTDWPRLIGRDWLAKTDWQRLIGWDWLIETDWSRLVGWDWLVETDWPRLIGRDWLVETDWSRLIGRDWLVETGWSRLVGRDWLVETDWSRLIGQDWLAKTDWPRLIRWDWFVETDSLRLIDREWNHLRRGIYWDLAVFHHFQILVKPFYILLCVLCYSYNAYISCLSLTEKPRRKGLSFMIQVRKTEIPLLLPPPSSH